jgi:hypothetical protein
LIGVAVVGVVVVAIAAFTLGSGMPAGLTEPEASSAPAQRNVIALRYARQRFRAPLPAIVDLPVVSAQDAEITIRDEDFVLGVEIASESRAYAINMMGRPESELLNDTLADRPIAVTFCSNCRSPLVFLRQVEGKTLTLHVTGELIATNMVMRDAETGSDWIQLTGEAIDGPLKGRYLERIPVAWTDWKTWRERHPATTLPKLPNVVQDFRHHQLYSAFPAERSFFSSVQWSLARGLKARSWPYAQLLQKPVVNDAFAGQPLLVVFDRKTSTASAYDRRSGDMELTFRSQGNQVTDDQTGSVWDPITGLAIKGPLKERRLTPVAGIVSLVAAWRTFHPESETWSAEATQSGANAARSAATW